LVDTAENFAFVTLLETGPGAIMGMSRPRHSGGKSLGRTGLRNKRMIVYIRIIVVFGRMGLATDLTGLQVKPASPRRIGRMGSISSRDGRR
jgi:hypothetical protein